MSRNSLTRTVVMLLALMTFFNAGAYAETLSTFRLRIEDTVSGMGRVITDNVQLGLANLNGDRDQPATAGLIYFQGYIGANTFVTVYATSGILGDGSGALRLSARVQNLSATGGSVKVTLEDSGYAAGSAGAVFTGTVAGFNSTDKSVTEAATLTGSVSSLNFQTWINTSNIAPTFGSNSGTVAMSPASVTIPVGSVAAFGVPGTSNLSDTASVEGIPFNGANYAMFAQATLGFSGLGAVDFTLTGNDHPPSPVSTSVPEPTSLLLLSSGLTGLALLRRKKRSNT